MEPEQYFPSSAVLWSTRWWTKETVAVVTGGNKGIGFALVKRLAELGLSVVLTARDKQKGEDAVEAIRAQLGHLAHNHVHFLLLDVSDHDSIKTFASSFKAKFGATLDILVNNAGVSYNELDENSVDHAESVLKTNFYGPKLLIEELLPLFRFSSSITRILNVSSRLGSLNKLRNAEVKKMLESEELKEEEIEEMVKKFVRDVRNGTWKSEGWPSYWTDYAVSKLALNAYSKVLAKRYNNNNSNNSYKLGGSGTKLMSVNCFCPGFTQTSMTKGKGTHTADQAASLAAILTLLPPHHLPTGKFFLLRNNTTFLHVTNSKL
ncbi:unnamed protein product [Trifolium pratense]|uniref:Uncharacterized protein n=1 Tax=Trifolium pratense TaxID=57577 RepID=A0ACB0KDM7_TRIPR|nr:unnamed protein product [Trifolium pratense]